MLLYDGAVYEITGKGRRNGIIRAMATDVEFMNRLQAISCKEHVYFRSDEEASRVEIELRKTRRRRGDKSSIVREAVDPENDADSLIHMAKRMHNLAMKFSFMQVRRSAQRIPVSQRGRYDRRKAQHVVEQKAPYYVIGNGQSFVATRTHYPLADSTVEHK